MENQSDDGRHFIMLPTALLPVLSNTALRIILYAIYRERLVELGYLKDWCLYLTDVENRFGKLHGYSRNTIRNGVKELAGLNLLNLKGDHYDLNVDEIRKWCLKDTGLGLPNSGSGGLPKSGRAGVPKSGSVEKKDKEKRSKKEEKQEIEVVASKEPARPPVRRNMTAEEFEKYFPATKSIKAAPKTTEQIFAEAFPNHSSAAVSPEAPEKIPPVSGPAPKPEENLSPSNSETPAQTARTTDAKRRQND